MNKEEFKKFDKFFAEGLHEKAKELYEKIVSSSEEKRCENCKYKWFSRVEKPRQCPNCKRQIKYTHLFEKKYVV